MRYGVALVLAAVAMAVVMAPVSRTRPVSSMSLLRAPFRRKVIALLAAMRRRGFRPVVWETGRSDERVAELAERGTGAAKSMHSLGLAADIVDAEKLWSNPEFFRALAEEVERVGLYRVKHKNRKTGKVSYDLPHVQAAPGSRDAEFRRASPEQRDEMLTRLYAKEA